MAQKCREAGVSFAAGQVNQLIIENGDVRGARLKEGEEYYADDLVILAAGSWSPAVFPELKDAVTATGQVLATIQLTAEEADEYSRTVSEAVAPWPSRNALTVKSNGNTARIH
jgi:glycine/D-amino acid oxidase-like deaminating enzyme